MRIDVLGPLRLEGDDGHEREIPERKVRLLLLALVAQRGAPLTVDALVERVWGQEPPAHPVRTVRAKVSVLRSLLDDARPGARALVVTVEGGYRLDASGGPGAEPVVDADRFARVVDRARDEPDPATRARLWADALSLWRGPPFADAADEVWLAPAVAELADQRLTAVEERAEALLESGAAQEALDEAGPAAVGHPTRERLGGAVMLALYRLGRQHEALYRFAALRTRLADELGVDPGPALRALHERILRQEDGLELAPHPAPAPGPRTNLPAPLSPLIGRDTEAAELDRLLDVSRLVTLVGPGGVGKTRLAVHVARSRRDRHRHGVWFVDLSVLRPGDGDRVGELLALALGVRDADGADPGRAGHDRVIAALGAGGSLLVLDNCEHVVDDAAALVAELLARAESTRVLTTSREPLSLPGEQRYHVPVLRAGDAADPGPAVALFAERARAVTDDFVLDADTAAVVELCRRLDGLPLALELAANRLNVLSVAELTERLTDRLTLLSRPGRGGPRRQQTLRGTVDWSHSLLDEPERVLLRRLAVHRGGFTLGAARVCAGDLGGGVEVLEVLGGLVDRSLVVSTRTDDGVRFGLTEVVAEYAAEKLDAAGERDEVARRHLAHHLATARWADARIRGPGQREAIRTLDADRVDRWHARAEALRLGDGAAAVELALATFWYEWITGRWRRLGADLSAALALPGADPRARARASVLQVALVLADDPTHAARRAQRVVTDAARVLGESELARVRWFLGSALAAVGGPTTHREAAASHLRASLEVFARDGDDWHAAITLSLGRWWSTVSGGPRPEPPAGTPGRDPVAVLDELGDGWGVSLALGVEYREAELDGDVARSGALARRALELCRDHDLRDETVFWMLAVALDAVRLRPGAARSPSEPEDRVTALVAGARTLAAETGDADGLSFADLVESVRARSAGDVAGARAALGRRSVVGAPDVLATLEGGFLAVAEGDRTAAARARHAVVGAGLLTGAAAARVRELDAGLAALDGRWDEAERLLAEAAAGRAALGRSATSVERADVEVVRRLRHD